VEGRRGGRNGKENREVELDGRKKLEKGKGEVLKRRRSEKW
jgi:hypothetical protein